LQGDSSVRSTGPQHAMTKKPVKPGKEQADDEPNGWLNSFLAE
jgi:hypothetical protein